MLRIEALLLVVAMKGRRLAGSKETWPLAGSLASKPMGPELFSAWKVMGSSLAGFCAP